MSRCLERFVCALWLLLWGCGGRPSEPLIVGPHHVRLVPPTGWEHLDHGRQHLFRREEAQVALADLGPASREGLVHEIRLARDAWLGGRADDAFQRVGRLTAPPLLAASSAQLEAFWKPWNEVIALGGSRSSPAVGVALDSLEANVADLPPDSLDIMAAYALQTATDMSRREVRAVVHRQIHGRDWVVVETWNRLTHEDVKRVACVDDGGYLLALYEDRGVSVVTGPAFEALLPTIELGSATP